MCRTPAWKCLQLSPWLGAVRIFACTWAGMYLHSLVLNNACTDFVRLFPSLSNGCVVTVHVRRALNWLHCFPALFVAYGSSKLSRPFARFAPTAYFTAPGCSVYLIQTQFFFSQKKRIRKRKRKVARHVLEAIQDHAATTS